jgi:hypothetical protein
MIGENIYGFHAEGRFLCQDCAHRIFGTSLELYLESGEVQAFYEEDSQAFASKGLLCDECFRWIFQPEVEEHPWWREDPDPAVHAEWLAPFADFMEMLEIDVTNLRQF